MPTLRSERARTCHDLAFAEVISYNKANLIFCKVLDKQREKYGMTEQAIKETIKICKDRNVLKEYLEHRETEVVTIMMSLFDDERIMKTYAKDIEKETERKTAERMIKKGKMTLEEIADYIPSLSFDDLKEIETEIMQLA